MSRSEKLTQAILNCDLNKVEEKLKKYSTTDIKPMYNVFTFYHLIALRMYTYQQINFTQPLMNCTESISIQESLQNDIKKHNEKQRSMPVTALLKILKTHGFNLNEVDGDNKTALLIAVEHADEEIALALINLGANVNVHDNEQMSALYHAVNLGCPNIVQALINAGANLNALNLHELNALQKQLRLEEHFACGYPSMLYKIFKAGQEDNEEFVKQQLKMFPEERIECFELLRNNGISITVNPEKSPALNDKCINFFSGQKNQPLTFMLQAAKEQSNDIKEDDKSSEKLSCGIK